MARLYEVISWLKDTADFEFQCVSYESCIENFQTDIPKWVHAYVNYDDIVLDIWRKSKCYIVYDDGDEFIMLEDIGKKYDIWRHKAVTFFKEYPDNATPSKTNAFYIVTW